MFKLLISVLLVVCIHFCDAQQITSNHSYPLRRLTIEPAIGTRLNALMGSNSLQLSNLMQYNVQRKLSFVAHTLLSSDFKLARAIDVKQNYNFSVSQKVGIGTSFDGKKASNAFFILVGLKYYAYSGTLTNDQLPERETVKTSGVTTDYGVMYSFKSGRKKYFFSSRLYVPIKDGLAGIVENANVELGMGIRLK